MTNRFSLKKEKKRGGKKVMINPRINSMKLKLPRDIQKISNIKNRTSLFHFNNKNFNAEIFDDDGKTSSRIRKKN